MRRILEVIAELRRRRVFRAVLLWGVIAFAVLQVYEPVMHGLQLPDWTLRFVVVVLGLGFPVAAALSWVFDLEPTGIERTREVVRGLPCVAVLPFVNVSSDKEQEYFSDGVAEEILNALAQLDGLRVIGRTSSFSMKGSVEDLPTIGRRLGAAHLLEGSVRRAGARVRITAQLVEAAGGVHLWSREFDRELVDVFAVQDEIAHAVVAALKLKLLPAPRPEQRSIDPLAHDSYLLGLALLARGSMDAFGLAVQALRRAVELEPRYPQAWAALARARFWAADQDPIGKPPREEWPKAVADAERAIALAPLLADGYFARGLLLEATLQDWPGARSDLERARALSPGSPDVLLEHGWLLATLGNLPEAISAMNQAASLDPLAAEIPSLLSAVHLGAGQVSLAVAAAEHALAISPEHGRAARNLGFALLLQGRFPEARAAFHRSRPELFVHMGDAIVDHALGRAAESQRALDEILGAPYVLRGSYQVAQIYAWRGEADRAFEWLRTAVREHDSGLSYLVYDPLLLHLRGDSRFGALLEELKLPGPE